MYYQIFQLVYFILIFRLKYCMRFPSRKTTVAVRFNAYSNTEAVGSNPTRGMDVCVSLFSVCDVLRVDDGLIVQGVPPIVYRIKKLKKRPRPNKGL
jgi:hypothetical protein